MHVDTEKENKFEKVYGKQFWLSGPDLQHSELLLLQLSLTAKTARSFFNQPVSTNLLTLVTKNVRMVVK